MVGPLKSGKGFLRPGDDRDIFVCTFEIEKDHFMMIKPLYEALHHNLTDDGWKDPVSSDDKFESLYWERVRENGMKEHHMWWRIVKEPPHGSDFVRYAIKVDFQTIAVTAAEIPYKGKKAKVDRADLIIRFWFWVQWDWKDKFKKSIVKSLQQTFKKQLYKDEMDQHWGDLNNYAQELRTFCKDYLDMEEAGERPRQFHPEGGYKDQF